MVYKGRYSFKIIKLLKVLNKLYRQALKQAIVRVNKLGKRNLDYNYAKPN